MNIRVQGGTNAGRKAPLKPRAADWRCRCKTVELVKGNGDAVLVWRTRPGFLTSCPDCKTLRPS